MKPLHALDAPLPPSDEAHESSASRARRLKSLSMQRRLLAELLPADCMHEENSAPDDLQQAALRAWEPDAIRLRQLKALARQVGRAASERAVNFVRCLLGPALTTPPKAPSTHVEPYFQAPKTSRDVAFPNAMTQLCALGPQGPTRLTALQLRGYWGTIHGEAYTQNIKGVIRSLPDYFCAAFLAFQTREVTASQLANAFLGACFDDILSRVAALLENSTEFDRVADVFIGQPPQERCAEYLRAFMLDCRKRFVVEQKIEFCGLVLPQSLLPKKRINKYRTEHPASIRKIERHPVYQTQYFNPDRFAHFLRRRHFLADDPVEFERVVTEQIAISGVF